MLYYRVKVDNYTDKWTRETTVYNELLTEKEFFKRFPHTPNRIFEKTEISKRNVYFSFGCRFEYGTGANYDKNGRFFLLNHGAKVYYKD